MIKNLNNLEISLVYYNFRDHLKVMNESLEKGYRTEKIDLKTDEGVDVEPYVVVKMTPETIESIRESDYYKGVQSIVEKLRPVIELIEDAEPDIKEKIDK